MADAVITPSLGYMRRATRLQVFRALFEAEGRYLSHNPANARGAMSMFYGPRARRPGQVHQTTHHGEIPDELELSSFSVLIT